MPRPTCLAVLLATASLASPEAVPSGVCAGELLPLEGDSTARADEPQRGAAVGQLRQYRHTRGGPKRYVLVNPTGKVLSFLVPTEGVELRPYLGRHIGVTGRSLVYRRGRTPSIFVEKITELDAPQPPTRRFSRPYTAAQVSFLDRWLGREPYADVPPGSGEAMDPSSGFGPPWVSSPYLAGDACGPCSPPQCGLPGWMWFRIEPSLWWLDSMELPPLVTTSSTGTPRASAGVLGQPGTQILFGNQDFLGNSRWGLQFLVGGWITPNRRWGLEADYLGLEQITKGFQSSSNAGGNPILARPFFNINPTNPTTGQPNPPARQDAELIAFPAIITGDVAIAASNSFHSTGIRLRRSLCCDSLASNCCSDAGSPGRFSSVDLLVGYRYMRLKDRLTIAEDLTSLDPANPGQFAIQDQFETRNEFNGIEVGTVWDGGWYRWTWEVVAKTALGNVRQIVDIDGSTTATPLIGPSQTFSGGLLAQRSNIGYYSRDEFAVVPELGLTLGYLLAPRLRGTVGYTLIYWSRVARPGGQIDLDVNPDLLPPEAVPFTGPLRPQFVFHDTDLWAQGLRFGLDYRW